MVSSVDNQDVRLRKQLTEMHLTKENEGLVQQDIYYKRTDSNQRGQQASKMK